LLYQLDFEMKSFIFIFADAATHTSYR